MLRFEDDINNFNDFFINVLDFSKMGGTLGRYAEKGPKDKVSSKGIDSNIRLSIDEAVITSVRQVGNPELYVKLLSNIVLAGGSTMFPYFGKILEEMYEFVIQNLFFLEILFFLTFFCY